MKEQEALESPAIPAIDVAVDELGQCLDLLIRAYRDAFEFVHRSAFIDSVSVDHGARWLFWPITKWFVEAHLRTQFVSISHNLRLLQLRHVYLISEGSQKKLDTYAEFMEQSSKVLFSWERLRKLFTVILGIYSVISYLIGREIDLTSVLGVAKGLSTIDVRGAETFLFIISFGVIGVMILFGIMGGLSKYGFSPKRAIFLGGTMKTKYGDFLPAAPFNDELFEENWKGFPKSNIYNLENKVYKNFHPKKPIEFPMDLCFGDLLIYFVFPFFFAVSALLFYGILWGTSRDATFNTLVGIFIILLSFYVWYPIRAWKTYQKRKRSGNI